MLPCITVLKVKLTLICYSQFHLPLGVYDFFIVHGVFHYGKDVGKDVVFLTTSFLTTKDVVSDRHHEGTTETLETILVTTLKLKFPSAKIRSIGPTYLYKSAYFVIACASSSHEHCQRSRVWRSVVYLNFSVCISN